MGFDIFIGASAKGVVVIVNGDDTLLLGGDTLSQFVIGTVGLPNCLSACLTLPSGVWSL
ncbi:MAG: hypothetical protein WAZ74_06500 [Psychrobacter sp.]